jgi:CheY-like chemotaxis protein
MSRLQAIAFTAFAKPEDRVSAQSAGFQMHMSKPMDPTELAQAIASTVGRTDKPEQ